MCGLHFALYFCGVEMGKSVPRKLNGAVFCLVTSYSIIKQDCFPNSKKHLISPSP